MYLVVVVVLVAVVVVVVGAHRHWSPTYVTAAALMMVAECLMARSGASTAPHGGNTGTSLGLKVRSAVVVHLAQEKKKSCLKKKSCWNWSLGPAGEPEEEWEQHPGQPAYGDCSHDQN